MIFPKWRKTYPLHWPAMESRDRAALNDLLRLLDGPAKALGADGARLRWTTVPGLALILARWANEGGRLRTLWVDAPTEAEAQALAHDLAVLLPDAGVAYFPGFAPFAGGESSPPGMVLKERLSTLVGLVERRVQILVATPLAAQERLPHPTWFVKQTLAITKGTEVPRELLLETLVDLGYRRTDLASDPGEFSARGLVVDIWPDHLEAPLRMEFFGDELEKLSPFDPDTQRRTGKELETLTLYPRFEGAKGTGTALLDAVQSRANKTTEPDDDLAFRRARFATHGHFPGEELFYPMLGQTKGQLTHWVPPCLRVKLDPAWAEGLRNAEKARIDDSLTVLRRGGVVCPDFEDRYLDSDPSRTSLVLTEWQAEATVPLQAQAAREFQGRLSELHGYLQELTDTGHRVILAGSTSGMRDRLGEIIAEYELPKAHGTEAGCSSMLLPISAGVYLKEPQLLILTEREVFGRKAIPSKPQKSRTAAFL
ncbi:MAG: hypothetical protein Q8O00_08745, partial [Holophaga sp.]|nr:hypothetical protein [Holophaga sp.]